MKKSYFIIFIFSIFNLVTNAQHLPFIGQEIIDYTLISDVKVKKKYATISNINRIYNENAILEINTHTQPNFIYHCATAIPLVLQDQPIEKDRVFLLSFEAKTTESSLETGEAKLQIVFRQSKEYQDNQVNTLSLSSKWNTYYVPFKSSKTIIPEYLKLVLHYGYKPQIFQLKSLSFKIYPKGTDISELPKTKITYDGIDANASWRKDATKRIEKIRKGSFKLHLLHDLHKIKNQKVHITLKKHAFPFGAAIRAKDVLDNTPNYQNFKNSFSLAVLENDLKIKSWNKSKKDMTLQGVKRLKNDSIQIKGHVLIWPGFNYLTKEIKQNQHNPEKIKEIMDTHLNDILDKTNGLIHHWDVVNEAYTNKDLQRITKSEGILYKGFTLLKEKQPQVGRFTNEYGIISKGGTDTKKREWYFNFIKRIDHHTKGLVDGIGLQSHIGSDLTPPLKVLEILDYYAKLNKKISISEFTMDIQDPVIREKYTKDFMITAFSHPSVTEFLFWGCTEDQRKKVDIFKADGTIGAMGKAYFSLVNDTWKTDFVETTNNKGVISGNGFFGTYEYTFELNGKQSKGTFEFNENNHNITINVK